MDELEFTPHRAENSDEHIGYLCPVCHRVYCAGKYVLLCPIKGTNIPFVRLADRTTSCPFCEQTDLPLPLFIENSNDEVVNEVVSPEQVDMYIPGDELTREDIRPEVFDTLLENEDKWTIARQNIQ